MADEVRGGTGGTVPGPPDPGFYLFYYRNYNNDATDLVGCALTPSQPIMSITECGFTEQDGYRFKEWNTSPNGSATSYSVGDPAPSSSLFAIWEEAIDDICVSYKGSNIVTMSASGTKTLETEGKYCEDDITITYTKPAAPVPTLQTKSVTYAPSTSHQTSSITADAGYDALGEVIVNVNAMPSGSATTPATTITANPTISVSSGGLITASVSGSQSVTPTVSAGYVSSGTAGTVSVSGSNSSQLPTQAAQTITPTTTNQTIASGKYLTGTQTIEGIVCTNLTAGNIADGVTVKIGTATDDDSVASVTGTHQGGGGASTTNVSFASSDPTTNVYYVDQYGTAQSWVVDPLFPGAGGFSATVPSKSLLTYTCRNTSQPSNYSNCSLITTKTGGSGNTKYVCIIQAD